MSPWTSPICSSRTFMDFIYLNVVGEPVEVGIGVFHSEEHVASWYDPALGDSFDPNRKTAIMFLTQKQAHVLQLSYTVDDDAV